MTPNEVLVEQKEFLKRRLLGRTITNVYLSGDRQTIDIMLDSADSITFFSPTPFEIKGGSGL